MELRDTLKVHRVQGHRYTNLVTGLAIAIKQVQKLVQFSDEVHREHCDSATWSVTRVGRLMLALH